MQVFATTAALFAVGCPGAAAADWVVENVSDHLRGRVGVGTAVGGMFEDGGRRRTGQLWAYCADNSTVVNVASEFTYFGSSSMTVRYSLDGGPAQTIRWDYCQGGKCAGLWGGQGIPFLKALFDKSELKMVIERRFDQPLNATFQIRGAKDALTPVGEACGWIPKAKN